MKKLFWVLLLLLPSFALAAPNDPSSYTLTAHVSSSIIQQNGQNQLLRLEVTIDGKKLTLVSSARQGLLLPGDYKVKIVKDEHKVPYKFNTEYEFLYPDQKTETFQVFGISE